MTYRVIQWATGGVGRASIEGIVSHPELELVGVWVHSAEKVGRDVGEILGREPLGVTAIIVPIVSLAYLSCLAGMVWRLRQRGGWTDLAPAFTLVVTTSPVTRRGVIIRKIRRICFFFCAFPSCSAGLAARDADTTFWHGGD